jgi:Mg-chelatase subunit ChlD
MEANKNIPDSFFCELSHQVMKDPVLDRDGHSYERSVITEYIGKNGASPITFQALSLNDLVPNMALKKTIEEYFKNQKVNEELNDQEKQKDVGVKNELQVQASLSNQHVMVSVVPPNTRDEIARTPTSVVCVIDVSGSMQLEANIKSEAEDSKESYGFNTLDLVKHALRTIIKSMTKDDKLALVSFSTKAKVELDLTKMDDAGQKKAEKALNALEPDGSTNLWDGLYRGMELLRLRKGKDLHKNAAVLLLTDGQPNEEPPRGYIPEIQKYKEDLGGELPGIINTFGFGYSLDSKLLNDIAVIGKGAYAFIPDGSFVGTIFVNSMSNLLSNFALNVTLEVDLGNLKVNQQEDILKNFDKKTTEKKLEFKLGSVQFGQKKSLILPVTFLDNENKVLSGTLKYTSPFNDAVTNPFQVKIVNINDPQAEISYFRLLSGNVMLAAVDSLQVNQEDLKSQTTLIDQLMHQILASNVKDDKFIKDLIIDLKEQVTLALSKKEFYIKWGKHYLPSLARAHLLQQCNNFKDPGVQNYGGDVFQKNRDKLDQIFLALPAPEPSIKSEANVHVNNMANFYNQHGGCIDGECLVLMHDGSFKKIKEIKQGDLVTTGDGKSAKVKCVVKTTIGSKKTGLVCLEGGLKLTPWHPVRINGIFEFPINLGLVVNTDCEVVYNFVLEENHIMNVNGVECVTLGHGFQENVVKHEYFGTGEVVKDLQKVEGWQYGLVILKNEWVKINEETGRINKITQV